MDVLAAGRSRQVYIMDPAGTELHRALSEQDTLPGITSYEGKTEQLLEDKVCMTIRRH